MIAKTYLRCFDLEACISFYRALLKQDGVRVGGNEYAFDLDGVWLACVRDGGHEQIHRPLAIVLKTETLPTPLEIAKAGGRHERHFDFAVPAGETAFATDPDGNSVCFVLSGAKDPLQTPRHHTMTSRTRSH